MFSGQFLNMTNLTLDPRLFGIPEAVDSQRAAQVTIYTVSKVSTHLPPITGLP